MTTLRSVLVLGPLGGFGKFLLDQLVQRKSEFRRIAAFRNMERAADDKVKGFEALRERGVEIVSGTFDTVEAFKGFDVVIAPLGNHGIKEQPRIIDTAVAAGVRHFYPSEFGADLTVPGNWEMRYYRDKVLTREHLQSYAKKLPDFGYTYFVNGRFSEWSIMPHFGIFPATHSAVIYGHSESKQSMLPVVNAAEYLICTLLDPIQPGIQERTYRFIAGNYSSEEVISTVELVQGVKYVVTYKPVEEAIEREKRGQETGDIDLELEGSHQYIQGSGRTLVPAPYDNGKFPHIILESLETSIRRVIDNPADFPLSGLRA